MKKILSILSIGLILTGCSLGKDMRNTPTKQVETYLNQYQTLDSNVLTKLDSLVDQEELFDDDQKITYKDILKKHYQDLTYTIKEETVNGDKATVETEIEVNSFEETNELLEGLGFSYRSYQEKRREKFILNEHEIDIDTWPKLSPYIEIEGSDKNDIENILNTLGYSFEDTISCTVDEVYKKISLDINNMKELKF